jgi:hypothetical protein
MSEDIKQDLMNANARGVAPPQDWTTRAIARISYIERENAQMIDAFKHIHVATNHGNDFCASCGLYLYHPVHIRLKK